MSILNCIPWAWRMCRDGRCMWIHLVCCKIFRWL